MSRLVNLMRGGPIDVQYQGASFRFYHQGSATERGALFNPDYNLDELDFLRRHTPAGGVFVDVGANVGTFALVMAQQVGANGQGGRDRTASDDVWTARRSTAPHRKHDAGAPGAGCRR